MRTEPRKISFEVGVNPHALGSVISQFGATKVYITASLEDSVPSFLKGGDSGWVTAEYNMLPGATHTRSRRERSKIGGRTYEIQRLIGRSLRAIVDLKKLGERTITLDCDVLVADGGTRTASISGAYVALALAIQKLLDRGEITETPIKEPLAALSVGLSAKGEILADLNYSEDSSCEVDMNVIMTKSSRLVEIQGTAEGEPFSFDQLDQLLVCAQKAMQPVFDAQESALK